MEIRLSHSSAPNPISGREKEEEEKEAGVERDGLKKNRVARGSSVQRVFREVPTSHLEGQHPLSRASSISTKQNSFSFKPDTSHFLMVWAGLGIGFAFAQLKVSRAQGPPILPHLLSQPLKLIARKTPCSRGQMEAQEAILFRVSLLVVTLSGSEQTQGRL